jgi:hypothetical protein
MQLLVVLRARQRREAEEFQDIDRQCFLDDLDVARDRFRRVSREAEDVASVGDDAMAPPLQQHLAVFPDLVLALLGAEKRFRIDVLEPDEHEGCAGARCLLDEIRNPMAERIDLQDQLDAEFFALAQLGQPVEDGFPIAVAGEIVVGDEKARDPLRRVGAHDRLHVVGGAVTRNSTLHVDDGAEAALERAAAAGIEARIFGEHELDQIARQDRRHRARQLGHVVEIVVDRLGRAVCHLAQHVAHAALGLAGEQMNAEIQRLLHFRRDFRQHGETAADMEAAHDHRHAERAKFPAEIERARKLVRLHADQTDHAAAGVADALGDRAHVYEVVAFIAGFDLDLSIGTEHALLGTVFHQRIDAGEAVRGNVRAAPLNNAVGIVVRRLD